MAVKGTEEASSPKARDLGYNWRKTSNKKPSKIKSNFKNVGTPPLRILTLRVQGTQEGGRDPQQGAAQWRLPPRGGEERQAEELAALAAGMQRRAAWWLWLWLLCCSRLVHGDTGPGDPATPTWPRNPEREAAAFRESLHRHRYLNSVFPRDNATALYGINQFSHLFPAEFKAIYLRSKPYTLPIYPTAGQLSIPSVSLPLRFDWRDKHVVTQVRNQQMCGGCWAFSVVGAMESVGAIKGQPLEDLSVQQVIDCSYNNHGCSGGSPISALGWLNKTHVKLVKDSEYPFKAYSGLCHYFSSSQPGSSIKGYSAYDFSGQEDEMAKALLTFGPLVVIVDAVSWQDYLGGIIQHHCSSGEANHAVLITGFDRTGGTPYWMVRNSWGSSWGVEGYAHVKMGSNICGIADSVSVVLV
ncbi:cathepsin O [Ctenodactylus gundi]